VATRKQVQAAKRNVRRAQRTARAQRTIAKLPRSTRRDLGRQAAAGRRRGGLGGTLSKSGTVSSCTRWRRSEVSPADPRWANGNSSTLSDDHTEARAARRGWLPSTPPVDSALQLRVVHRGAATDAHLPSFFVELVARPSSRAFSVRTQSTSPTRRDIRSREARALTRLAAPRALLVHGPCRDLFGAISRGSALAEACLDVLVLTLVLLRPRSLRHVQHLR